MGDHQYDNGASVQQVGVHTQCMHTQYPHRFDPIPDTYEDVAITIIIKERKKSKKHEHQEKEEAH
jgi:hypothetical protein